MWRSLVVAMLAGATGVRAAETTRMKFLALGDSYTIGEGVAPHERWPDQLVAALRKLGIDIGDAEIVARTGWTTDELSGALEAHTLHPPYALVTLLIGVNNQYRGRDVDNYRTEFSALIERAIALAGGVPGHVVVVSIPDWGVTRFGRESGRDVARIARELDEYNAANAQIATMRHVRYVDVAGVSRDGGERADMLVSDGLHPSAAMYARWLEAILPAARAALEQDRR
jgi:lysophospholipase L1-like esterase